MATQTTAQAKKSFFSKLAGFFKRAKYYVSEVFVKLFGKDAAQHFTVSAVEVLKSDLGKIAVTAVKEAEAMAAGTDKRAVAFEKIAQQVAAQGIAAGKSIIYMLIELAVQNLGAFGQG